MPAACELHCDTGTRTSHKLQYRCELYRPPPPCPPRRPPRPLCPPQPPPRPRPPPPRPCVYSWPRPPLPCAKPPGAPPPRPPSPALCPRPRLRAMPSGAQGGGRRDGRARPSRRAPPPRVARPLWRSQRKSTTEKCASKRLFARAHATARAQRGQWADRAARAPGDEFAARVGAGRARRIAALARRLRPLLSGGTPVRLRWCVPQARGRLWAARPCSLTCPLHVRERVPALTRHARSLRCPVALRRHARALYSLGPGHWVGGGAAVAALRAWCGAHVPGRSRSARAGRDAQQERHRGGVEAALRCLRGCAS